MFPFALNWASFLSALLEGFLSLLTVMGSGGDQPCPPKVSFYQYPSLAHYRPSEIPRSSGKYLTAISMGRLARLGEASSPRGCQGNSMNSLKAEIIRAGKSMELHQLKSWHPTPGTGVFASLLLRMKSSACVAILSFDMGMVIYFTDFFLKNIASCGLKKKKKY